MKGNMEIASSGYVFAADVEKTKEYYRSLSLCDCAACQYYRAHIKSKFPKLEAFLAPFGVDITKPDETSPIELDGAYDYTFVGYTVCGEIVKTSGYEIDIDDNLFISISVDSGSKFPNNQDGAHFSFSVFGISLPCDTAKAAKPDPFFRKIKRLFRR